MYTGWWSSLCSLSLLIYGKVVLSTKEINDFTCQPWFFCCYLLKNKVHMSLCFSSFQPICESNFWHMQNYREVTLLAFVNGNNNHRNEVAAVYWASTMRKIPLLYFRQSLPQITCPIFTDEKIRFKEVYHLPRPGRWESFESCILPTTLKYCRYHQSLCPQMMT